MNLIPSETVLTQLDSKDRGKLELTSHRVRQTKMRWSTAEIDSIVLEDVASCSLRKRSYPVLLLVAVLVGAAAAALWFTPEQVPQQVQAQVGDPRRAMIAAGAVALLCLMIFVATRKLYLVIESTGGEGKILFSAKGVNPSEITTLIDRLEGAKVARLEMEKSTRPAPVSAPSPALASV